MFLPIHVLNGPSMPPIWWAVPIFLLLFILSRALRALLDPLRKQPGPFAARFTRLWLLRQYTRGDYRKTNIELHKKYGPIVRIAPGQYSIDSLEAAKIIYGHGSHFVKSDFYITFGDPNRGNLFTYQDPKTHAHMRRQVSNVYTMSSMVSYEPYVDECADIFLQRLSEVAASGKPMDLGHWFQCYAFDVIGQITFSKSFQCLDAGQDPQGIIKALEDALKLSSAMGVYPSIWPLLFKVFQLFAQGKNEKGHSLLIRRVQEQVDARQKEDKVPDGPQDFIMKLVHARKERPDAISEEAIFLTGGANVAAGSDTTSISLSGIMYNLLKNPHAMQKLRKELDDAVANGSVSSPITFKESQALPYLQAVIKEGLRMHPATGFTMPRVVPKGGRPLAGTFFPEGNVVGINSWVAHHNEDIYGRDAKYFRPERWLDSAPEQKSRMESYFFAFGQGSRTCIGKNISLLEISKTIPRVVQNFDFTLENQDEMDCDGFWFVKPRDFRCLVRKRVL
ncbi:cytochrome p450 pisatin [Colletotrichum truncatum]|uniref:Cytochrome p450 pisatin n=1 Tax=Colletotrichum truncatum TaxID=5467 RepID=A0ACC3YZT6_COLTU|nr:cytochrome p450 pisatin [Colletotrichum truncatum]KAF6786312.1 cytochrome p450 pisatin [Colletotrichum truncatum]